MRIGGTNRLVNHGKPLFKLRGNLVLITNTQKFKVKRRLATSSSTYRTPFAVGRSGSPFNQVQHVLNISIHIGQTQGFLPRPSDYMRTSRILATYPGR